MSGPAAIVETAPAYRVEGYLLGLATGSTRVTLDLSGLDPDRCGLLHRRLSDALESYPRESEIERLDLPSDEPSARAVWLGRLFDRMLAHAGMAFRDRTRVMLLDHARAAYYIPSFQSGTPATAALAAALVGLSGDDPPPAQEVHDVLRALADAQPYTSNGPRLARAALELGYPFAELPGKTIQLGLGRNSIRLNSTLTDETRTIAVDYARQKHLGSALLARGLVPVAPSALAGSADWAVRWARNVGYPIVVKPANRDGGIAVEAGLNDDASVRKAFAAVEQTGAMVMVERHVPGRDYRFTVFRGKMVWAIERRAAGVEGDGIASVAQLVARANADPARGEGPHARLKRLKLDEVALDLLAEQHLSPDAVPEEGQIVRLTRKSNVTAGGLPIAVTDSVHPDNAALAVRAARLMRLDLAGVDLILPDHRLSWRETGGAVIEVNAMPEIGGTTSLHLYPWLLERLVPEDGQIPVVAVLGGHGASMLATDIAARLSRQGSPVGLALRQGVRLGDGWITRDTVSLGRAGRCLASEPDTASIVLEIWDPAVARDGLPVPVIDRLVLDGHVPLDADGVPISTKALFSMLVAIWPHCKHVTLLNHEQADAALLTQLSRLTKEVHRSDRDTLLEGFADLASTILPRVASKIY